MTKVKLKSIKPQTVDVWNSDGFFANVNEYEFNDIRIQIKQNQEEGWFVYYNGHHIMINSNGRLRHWPEGMFDLFTTQLGKLCS